MNTVADIDLNTLVQAVFTDVVSTLGQVKGVAVRSLCLDSRRVTPGALFFAVSGQNQEGAKYIKDAVANGAVGIVCAQGESDLSLNVVQIEVAHVRKAMAKMATAFYNTHEMDFPIVGVTGTNGKTTVTHILEHGYSEMKKRCAIVGTIECRVPGRSYPAAMTTPESLQFQRFLSLARDEKVEFLVSEVSSHGLSLNRLHGVRFHTSAFLNLTTEHLDFHESMEEYFNAKCKLFDGGDIPFPKNSVINLDDPYGVRLINEVQGRTELFTFSTRQRADFYSKDVSLTDSGIVAEVVTPVGDFDLKSKLLGEFNLSNILASIAIAYTCGVDLEVFIKSIESFKGAPGRLERVEVDQPFTVLVDYAHTPDALSNVLSMLKSIAMGRLITVFGCGGNRDRSKRALMTQAALSYSDEVIATSDNPRHEALDAIFKDMQTGVSEGQSIEFIADRRLAIEKAITVAQSGDMILIAGKGHEKYQIFGDTIVNFDDVSVAAQLAQVKMIPSVSF